MKIGLTGGIASGKTTVAEQLGELGAAIIDTDRISRELVAPGQPALNQISGIFGPDILLDDRSLDRKRLRNIVFSDASRRRQLEQVLHPLIREEMLRQAQVANGTYTVLVVPLLVETGMTDLVDRVLVVDCDPQQQRSRLALRDGETPESVEKILGSQSGRAQRLAAADDLIVNNRDLASLRQAVETLDARYRMLAA